MSVSFKSIRKSLGLTQDVMAQLLETSRATISLVELNMRILPTRSAQLLSGILEQQQKNLQRGFSAAHEPLVTVALQKHNDAAEFRKKKFEYSLEKCRKKLAFFESRLNDIQKSVAILSTYRTPQVEPNIYKKKAAISRQSLISRDLPYYTQKVERIRMRVRWLEGESSLRVGGGGVG
jgi:transcriptional regulator with XRE-family HTH domain